ncbi:hypothetical protein SDC9_98394 [bioreactor metagenome]|uniref:Uncharacterized protein n=1 Tax=bioreactor metagenome TaxID=1076179 RepID=A0A645ALC1_9ZZZZ
MRVQEGGKHRENLGVLDENPIEFGQERGMPAVVRPVGVYHLQLRQRGVAALVGKIALHQR